MKNRKLWQVLLILGGVLFISLFLVSITGGAEESSSNSPQKEQLQDRIDFGNSYIMGQSIKSGAVYLMHRKKSDIKSMLKSRENYRKEILEHLKAAGSKDGIPEYLTAPTK